MTRKISYEQYLSLLGLMTLADKYYNNMKEIEKTVAEIVQEEDDCGYYGHTSDQIWGNDGKPEFRVEELLNGLEISVEKITKKTVKQAKKK